MSKQIIIIGCPRSGTTYLLKLLASNTRFSWVSGELNNNPFDYHLSKQIKDYQKFFTGKRNYLKPKIKGTPHPVEPWNFWNNHFSYFQWKPSHFEIPKNALPEDVQKEDINKIRNAVEQICSFAGKDYFLTKYTDFPRIQLIKKAFPNAKFIHIHRDGRAVAASYLKKIESGDFNTSKEEKNWVSAWPKNWQDKYHNKYHNTLAFTLFQWQLFLKEITDELKTLNQNDFIEISYQELIQDTKAVTQKILNFANVDLDSNIKYYIKHKPGEDKNYKWKENITQEHQKMFNDIIEEEYKKYLDI